MSETIYLERTLHGISLSAPIGIVQIPAGSGLIVESHLERSERFTTVAWSGRQIQVFDTDLELCRSDRERER